MASGGGDCKHAAHPMQPPKLAHLNDHGLGLFPHQLWHGSGGKEGGEI